MKNDMIEMGKRILNRRKQLKLTQTDIYKACGIGSGQMSRIENGLVVPGVDAIILLSRVLDCDPGWLITGEYPSATFCKYEEDLLNSFRLLEEDQQIEIIDYVNFKVERYKKVSAPTSSPSKDMSKAV